jgi:hypothetical protein
MSGFNLSHDKKLTCNMGELVPILSEEVNPTEVWNVNAEIFVRLAPMVGPVMHHVNVYCHFFFVPYRIIWDDWEDFMTGGQDGLEAPNVPSMNWGATRNAAICGNGSLADYLGLPPYDGTAQNSQHLVSLLPFRAYQQIFNDYYRDPNLVDPVSLTTTGDILAMKSRAWENDYFTSSLPWLQRGAEIGVPVSSADIEIDDVRTSGDAIPTGGTGNLSSNPGSGQLRVNTSGGDTDAKLIGNSSNTIDFLINDLRRTSAIQRTLEMLARGGARYTEFMHTFFGQRSLDGRLQRAEYLGGGKQPLVISEVLNTSATATEPQGNMSGHGISVSGKNNFNFRVPEFGMIIGIMSIMPRTTYGDGIPRKFTKLDKYKYLWPTLANIGEQVVENREVFWDKTGGASWDTETFGYQDRYAEYKYIPSSFHGEFRDNNSYGSWGLQRRFSARPALNEDFVVCDPSDRIFAVAGETNYCIVQIFNSVKAIRPLPYFSNYQLT